MLTQRQATHCYDKAYNYIKNNGSKYFLVWVQIMSISNIH